MYAATLGMLRYSVPWSATAAYPRRPSDLSKGLNDKRYVLMYYSITGRTDVDMDYKRLVRLDYFDLMLTLGRLNLTPKP